MDRASAETVSAQTTTRRYWRRVEQPKGGWWPWGWLPVLGLIAAALYGMFFTAPELEAQTRDGVAQALRAAEIDGFDVKADGQRVLITGTGAAAIRDRLIAIARGAVCDTWLAKQLTCATHIDVDLNAPDADAVVNAVREAIPDAAPVAVATRVHAFSFSQSADGLVLEGNVPSVAIRDRIVAEARNRFGNVTDRLAVTDAAATEGYEQSISRAWQLLAAVENGGVTWNGSLSAWGRVAAEREQAVRDTFAGAGQAAGALNLEIVPSADTCNERFARLLAGAQIQFQTGSADIAAASQPLLRQLAALADECPIALDVEGHTDNVGSQALNSRLSFARAESVVTALAALGVDGGRLTPRGFGPDRPIADNETPEGRAMNRRIEIKASR